MKRAGLLLALEVAMVISALCALTLVLSGCVSVTTKAGKDKYGPYMEQTVSGTAKASAELVKQNFTGSLKIDPDSGVIDATISSGQDAEGLKADGLEVIVGTLMKAFVEALKTGS